MPIYLDEPKKRFGRSLEEFETPFNAYLKAKRDSAWEYGYGEMLSESSKVKLLERGATLDESGKPVGLPQEFSSRRDVGIEPFYAPPIRLSQEQANQKVKEAGVKIDIPEIGMTEPALNLLINRRKKQKALADSIGRSPAGFRSLLGFAVELGSGMTDPVNILASVVPVVSQTKYAMAIAKASGALGRAAVRAEVGAIQGAVGVGALEPFNYAMHQSLQDDYKMVDSLMNIGFGAAIGGTLHVGAGFIGDVSTGRFSRNQDLAGAIENAVQGNADLAKRSAVESDVLSMSQERKSSILSNEESIASYAKDNGISIDEVRSILKGDVEIPKATGKTAPELIEAVLKAEERRIQAENKPGFLRTAEDKIALEVGLDPSQLVENLTPELERAFEIAKKPGALRSAEERIFFDGMMKGREIDYLNNRLRKAIDANDDVEVAKISKRFEEIGANPQDGKLIMERVSQETKDGSMQTAITQAFYGRAVDINAVLATDKRSGINVGDPVASIKETAERQSRPEAVRVVNLDAAASADKQIADAPKSNDLRVAETELNLAEDRLNERAEILGITREMVKRELAESDELIVKAIEMEKAAEAFRVCRG